MKGVRRFRLRGKLSLIYIEPYQILEKIDLIVEKVALLEEYEGIHNEFNVFSLRKSFKKQP